MKSHANIPQAGTSHIERYQADTKIMLALLTDRRISRFGMSAKYL